MVLKVGMKVEPKTLFVLCLIIWIASRTIRQPHWKSYLKTRINDHRFELTKQINNMNLKRKDVKCYDFFVSSPKKKMAPPITSFFVIEVDGNNRTWFESTLRFLSHTTPFKPIYQRFTRFSSRLDLTRHQIPVELEEIRNLALMFSLYNLAFI